MELSSDPRNTVARFLAVQVTTRAQGWWPDARRRAGAHQGPGRRARSATSACSTQRCIGPRSPCSAPTRIPTSTRSHHHRQ